jgi:hypothetical protein
MLLAIVVVASMAALLVCAGSAVIHDDAGKVNPD